VTETAETSLLLGLETECAIGELRSSPKVENLML